jgi:hypothetical protein
MARLKVTEEEMDLLTEEERIGLKEYQAELDAEAAAEDAQIAAAAAGDPEEEPAPEPEPEDEEEEEEAAAEPEGEPEAEPEEEDEEEQPAAAAEAEAGEEEEEEPAPRAPPSILPAYKVPAEDVARMTAIEQQLDELAEKFDEGELTAKELRDQSKVLAKEQDELKARQVIAQMSGKMTVDTWYGTTIPLFLGQHPEYQEGSLRHELLDTLVRKMQMVTDNPTDPNILINAHKRIIDELGEVTAAAPAANSNGHAKKPRKQRDVPPKFADIPTSDQTQVALPNKFARLEKLKGVDYEKALARLSPADREAYLMGG